MSEEKKKKSSTPLFFILIAILLIAAGVVLIVTDNNKSFWEKEDTKNSNKQEQEKKEEQKEEEIPDRGMYPSYITEESILNLIISKKQNEFPGETWGVQYVEIVAHDEKDEKFLIKYGETEDNDTVVVKQTIVSVLNGDINVELPGWVEGERDLTVYNFNYYELEIPELGPNEYAGPELSFDE